MRSTSAAPFLNLDDDPRLQVLAKKLEEDAHNKENISNPDFNLSSTSDELKGSEDDDYEGEEEEESEDKQEVSKCQSIKVRNHEVRT